MPLINYITDISSDKSANVINKNHRKPNGLVVYTEPRQDFYSTSLHFETASNGANMNVDASTSGIALPVHNGNDTPLWTGSNITGSKVNFSSTDQAYTGTQSIKFNGMNNGDIAQIDNGAPVVLAGNYVALSFAVYVDSNWSAGDDIEIYGYDTVAGSIVGTSVSLKNYFDRLNTGVWQLAQIPLADMNLSSATIDSFRIEVVSTQASKPVWYMDILELEAAAGSQPIKFSIQANNLTRFYKASLLIELANNVSTVLASNSMANLDYTSFLGVTMSLGLQFSFFSDNKLLTTFIIKDIGDLMSKGFVITNSICDGSNTYLTLRLDFAEPIILDSQYVDTVNITVNDDLSGLLKFRTTAIGYEERFNNGN
jgi:hypothetical protein